MLAQLIVLQRVSLTAYCTPNFVIEWYYCAVRSYLYNPNTQSSLSPQVASTLLIACMICERRSRSMVMMYWLIVIGKLALLGYKATSMSLANINPSVYWLHRWLGSSLEKVPSTMLTVGGVTVVTRSCRPLTMLLLSPICLLDSDEADFLLFTPMVFYDSFVYVVINIWTV